MKVGQEVYLKNINIFKRKNDKHATRDKVKKVGRIYVTLEICGVFNIKTGEEKEGNHISTWQMYEDENVMQAVFETERLTELITKTFRSGETFELPKLQQIARIMGLSKSAEKPTKNK